MRGVWRVAGLAACLVTAVVAAACVLPPPASPPAPVANPGPDLWHVGRWFTDTSGRVVVFHGLNMVDKQAPYYPAAEGFDAADVSLMQSMGMNVVRLGVIFAGVMPQPGQVDQSYIQALHRQVDQFANAGIYVILDFHQDEYGSGVVPGADGFPGWATLTGGAPDHDYGFPDNYLFNAAVNTAFDNFWANAQVPGGPGTAWGDGLQNYYQQGLAAVASVFASDTNVLGYEIMNEPWPGSTWPTCLNPSTGCPAFDTGPYLEFVQRSISAIRSVDPDHLVLYEPNVLFNEGIPTSLGYVGDPGTAFAFHLYPLCTADHGGVFPGQDQVCGPEEARNFSNASSQEQRSGAAEIMTEWGNSTDDAFNNRQAGEADAAMMSWTFWSFDGVVVPDIASAPAGSNVNQNVVDDLARPYPKAIAGIPLDWSFNTSTKVFTLSYTTAPVGGGAFPAGTTTDISVPALVYSQGYKVAVSGASVVSAPGAPVLELAGDAGASQVNVAVGP